ncbi:MAG: helicase, partial [Myxococcota bacterium]
MNTNSEPCSRHFLPEAIEELRRQIADHGGHEVFLVGRLAEGVSRIQSVEVFCRGNAVSVPALMDVAQEGDVVIHNHPSGVLLPSEADLALASQYGERAVGFMIVNNSVDQVLVVVKPFARRVRQVVPADQIEALLGSSGLLARRLPGYESRPGQLDMSRLVLDAYNVDGIAVVEAGTGTGKSLAYLVPAALYALANRESVVVATHTINLQEQLYTKDAPMLTALPPFKELRVALLKGRSNYLCNRKFEYFRQNPLEIFNDEQLSLLESLDDWYERTEEGTRSELAAPLPEELWDRLAADEEDCTRVKCPHYDQCFFFKARREAAGAHILIVNQHLLMADLSVRLTVKDYKRALVLPPYRRIVLDEAHHLEDVATSFISGKVSTRGLLRILGRLLTARNVRRNGDERKGLLVLLQRRLSQSGLDESQVESLQRLIFERLEPAVDVLRQLTRDHLRELAAQVRMELNEQGIPN